jgi:hypothetical protein
VKRLVLLILAVAALLPATADAAVPCRDRIYNDWYPDGKIATNYPIACYRDALKHVRPDAREYSSLGDDIRSAMQAALARLHHKTVPAEVGKGSKPPVSKNSTSTKPHDPSMEPVSSTQQRTPTLASDQTGAGGGGGGVPLPLLVLGALALLLVAIGGVGVVTKRRRAS